MLRAAQLALDELAVEIEEVEAAGLERPVEDVSDERVERSLRDRPSAEAGHDVVHRCAWRGEPHVVADDPAETGRERPLDDDDPFREGGNF